MSNFINNSGANTLKERVVSLIEKSQELKFLVGFFYFSGIRELYESLKKNPDVQIKVLVGLNVDGTIFGLVEGGEKRNDININEKTHQFFQSLKKSLNTENFDTEEFYEQVKFFLQLIQDGRLVMRKTYNPNHAKLYIFHLEDGQVGRKELFVTGSSNLTKAGLTTQEEFNVEISDYGVESANEYFDALWNEAIKITEDDAIKKKMVHLIENETLVKEITPFQAYILVLKTYLESFRKKEISISMVDLLKSRGYEPYQYQLDAVRQALSIIEQNNGVIIADVVGLGKSVNASMIAYELGERGVVICPPGLIGDRQKTTGWGKYVEEFNLRGWEVWSSGDLEGVSARLKRASDMEVVILDEAHRFRNEDTQDYEHLKNICRDRKVILLSATPFNNRPNDILSLLQLFIAPKKSLITLENNLKDRFRYFNADFDRLSFIRKNRNAADEKKQEKAISTYQGMFGSSVIDMQQVQERARYLSKQIRDVIEPVTIRRNRLDLKNNPAYREEVGKLSEIDNPIEWFYKLTSEQSSFYDEVLKEYFGSPEDGGKFRGAIYRPYEYEVGGKDDKSKQENLEYQSQRNLYDFMRRLVVKRFESSFGAFEQTVTNFLEINRIVRDFVGRTGKYILDRKLIQKMESFTEEEILEELKKFSERLEQSNLPKTNKVYDLETFEHPETFLADIDSDIRLFEGLLGRLKELGLTEKDPKTACILENIGAALTEAPLPGEPRRKIIIFSEYVDTIQYLAPAFEKAFPGKTLVVAGDLGKQKIETINKNFDAAYKEESEDVYDVLLTSDRLSEGFNLNRAGTVINYDIPWNPVRVIQRVGRINRISKKVFDRLRIVNFFPTEQGADYVRVRQIAESKMYLIHNTLGEDSKIFDAEEEPTPAGLFSKLNQNPEALEEESFLTAMLRLYKEMGEKYPELLKELEEVPARVKVAKAHTENELVVFIRKGRMHARNISRSGEGKTDIQGIPIEDALPKVACEESAERIPFGDTFWRDYDGVKQYEVRAVNLAESSVEAKASNMVNTLLQSDREELVPYKEFLRMIQEDIAEYGTLSLYTQRRIANLGDEYAKGTDDSWWALIAAISELRDTLGERYLDSEKERVKNTKQEVIIAIENRNI